MPVQTNYEKYFGTPTRTARTLKAIDADANSLCALLDENCKACPYEYDWCGCYLPRGTTLAGWLKRTAE